MAAAVSLCQFQGAHLCKNGPVAASAAGWPARAGPASYSVGFDGK